MIDSKTDKTMSIDEKIAINTAIQFILSAPVGAGIALWITGAAPILGAWLFWCAIPFLVATIIVPLFIPGYIQRDLELVWERRKENK